MYIISKKDYKVKGQIVLFSDYFEHDWDNNIWRVPEGVDVNIEGLKLKWNCDELKIIVGKKRRTYSLEEILNKVIVINKTRNGYQIEEYDHETFESKYLR